MYFSLEKKRFRILSLPYRYENASFNISRKSRSREKFEGTTNNSKVTPRTHSYL